jgi:hypothetical protein
MIRFMTEKECRKDVSKKVPLYIFCIILFHRFTNVQLEIHYCERIRASICSDIDKCANYRSIIFLWHNSNVSNTNCFTIHNYSDAIHTYRKLIGKEITK